MELSDTEAPRHNVIDSDFDAESSSVTVICNGNKFVIEVEAEALDGTLYAKEYSQFAEFLADEDVNDGNDGDYIYEDMCEWMIRPCFPIFRSLAPPVSHDEELTIQDSYYPRTLRLELLIADQHLVARYSDSQHQESPNNLTIRSTELPNFADVVRLQASDIKIVLNRQEGDDLCELPRRVRTSQGLDCYFKPAFNRSHYLRELHTFTSIARAGLSHLKISRLVGIVVSDDAMETLGLVVEWIPPLWDLQSREARRYPTEHERWQEQVASTVEELHKNKIVWGDVHPGNILIDEQMDAWVIDFGGGWIEPFVPRRLRHTVDGDLHGIRKVFEYLDKENVQPAMEARIG